MTIEQVNKINAAQAFAHAAHDSIGQKRKFNGEPYWVHTDAVAQIVGMYNSYDADIVCAAHQHDILEDVFPLNPHYDTYLIAKTFGNRVAQLVTELTDVYTKEAYPDLNRAKRKKLEAERIAKISKDAKLVKLADVYHNTADIAKQDPGFAPVYLQEVWTKLQDLREGNEELYLVVEKQVAGWLDHFGIKRI